MSKANADKFINLTKFLFEYEENWMADIKLDTSEERKKFIENLTNLGRCMIVSKTQEHVDFLIQSENGYFNILRRVDGEWGWMFNTGLPWGKICQNISRSNDHMIAHMLKS